MIKRRRIILMLAMVFVIAGSGIGYYKYRAIFPYGQSHCCILGMMSALEGYAAANGGKYPAGGPSPEADLSLLYESQLVYANTLRGMTVPESTVQAILDRGDHLGPESCGWQYVPGLTKADNPKLALLWCKTALSHNGQRNNNGSREVILVGGRKDVISGDRWLEFLEAQKELMKRRSRREIEGEPLVTGLIELEDGSQINSVDVSYTLTKEYKEGPNSSGSGSSSGGRLTSSRLSWYRSPILDGQVTRRLSFSNLISDPVTVTFKGGVPNVTKVIFKMRSKRIQRATPSDVDRSAN